jgi:Flp pilus assembly protein TadD
MRSPELKSDLAPERALPSMTSPWHLPAWLLAVLLALVTVTLYWPVMHCDFVDLDDDIYVTANSHVQSGLTWTGIKWAFSNTQQADYWAPMMWLSHLLACQLFGLNPWGHHLINVLLHAVNTALVFLLFRRLTGATWRSFFVAALFGWHPLRVESVAWVTEQKDVLSAFFGLLSLIFYVRFVQQKEARSKPQGAFVSLILSPYCWSLFFFALGLMSKAMLVTWPFVMLLLDYWPLQRVSSFKFSVSNPATKPSSILNHQFSTLVFEKLPFFALAAAASVVTFMAQKHGGAVTPIENLPFDARCGNALISYCRYLGKLFWPTDLAVLYSHPGYWPVGQVLLAGGLILGITVLFIVVWRRYPFLLMGWLWFVGTLVPVIGLVQAGEVAMADRFSYIPSLGLLVLVIWGVSELTRRRWHQAIFLAVAGCATIILCLGLTRQQIGCWKDRQTLFRHALTVTKNNYLAHCSLGTILLNKGQTDEAISQFRETIQLIPDNFKAHNNLGNAFLRKNQVDEAINQFQDVIRLKPGYAEAHNNLGAALGRKGQIDKAISQFQEAIRLAPGNSEAHYNLGTALGQKGQIDEAISQFQEAIRLNPGFANAHNNLGIALSRKGQTDEAIRQFQEAIRWEPGFAEARNNLAHVLESKNAPAGR